MTAQVASQEASGNGAKGRRRKGARSVTETSPRATGKGRIQDPEGGRALGKRKTGLWLSPEKGRWRLEMEDGGERVLEGEDIMVGRWPSLLNNLWVKW